MESEWLLPLAGLAVGLLLGGVARWNSFCTLSALERHWYANDSRGLRVWVLAIVTAIASTQLLLFTDIVSLSGSFYLQPRFSLLGAICGGLMFGFGMALVGTCGFGALVRLGGGSMRSLIIVVTIGLSALVAQRGIIGRFRQTYIEPLAIDLSMVESQSLGEIASFLGLPWFPVASVIVLIMLIWLQQDRAFFTQWRSLLTGVVVGLCVTAGWLATETLQAVSFEIVQIESASFVLPPGELLYSLIDAVGSIPDYGVGLVVGVIAGAAIVATVQRDIRWEACDDARELNRHLIGAVLMGTGGVFASGCTVGQGISAASTLAISAPIVFASIWLGARTGLRLMLEGRPVFNR